jgi:group I intron endonuclease
MGKGTVYKITNIVNGKVYVGKTTLSIERRWAQHRSKARIGAPSYLHRAIRKYGEKSFVIEVIALASTEAELTALEIEWIAKLQSTNAKLGYNCTTGGEGQQHTESSRSRRVGWHHTPEALAKIRAANIGRKHTPEHREKWRKANVGRKQTPEEIRKRADANRKVWADPNKRREHGLRVVGRSFKWGRQKTTDERKSAGEKSRAWWSSSAADSAKLEQGLRAARLDHSRNRRKAWQSRRADPVKLAESNKKASNATKAWRNSPEMVAHYRLLWTTEKRKAFGEQIKGRKASKRLREEAA